MSVPDSPFRVRPATAIRPDRVLILTEREQELLAQALHQLDDDPAATRLFNRLYYGDEYQNEVDELVRTTFRKRVLEQAVRQCNRRITELEEPVIDQLIEDGHRKVTHAATGGTAAIDSKLWAKLDVDIDDDTPKTVADEIKARAKAAAGDALIAAGMGEYVRSDFNLNSVSAYFREQVKAYRAEQDLLPENERTPRPVEDFLPEPLRGHLVLDDTPTIRVTAPRS